jgi:hypothetical protein
MLVPLKELKDNPQQYGFKRCKKPYDNCWYRCFARGVKMMFLSKYMVDIIDWKDDDPRIHSRANCLYRDTRMAEDFLCELIQLGVVDTHYSKKAVAEMIEEAERIIKEGKNNDT